jgi:cephalosporin hydroxylase
MSEQHDAFQREKAADIARQGQDETVREQARRFIVDTAPYRYAYHFEALGRPIIQFPQDMVAMQELIWRVRPDLVIETGIAHGGSLVAHAAALTLLDYADAVAAGTALDPAQPARRVLGVDIEIRPHNRAAIETHPMAGRITMLEGSSIAQETIAQVRALAAGHERVLVSLDANHTRDHVLAELEAYAPLVSAGSYCVVFDTVIEHMPASAFPDRPWGPGNNPATAVRAFLDGHPEFEVDEAMDHKLLISVAPGGYLRRRG